MRTFCGICDDIFAMKSTCLILISILLMAKGVFAQQETNPLTKWCVESLQNYKGYKDNSYLLKACEKVQHIETCNSVEGRAIYHIDKAAKKDSAKNILVISLIHGDEIGAGTLGRYWMERFEDIDTRNNWRVIPVANPDGAIKKTRTNAGGVDLNRNFPTKDWDTHALSYWNKEAKKSSRKFPGMTAASEPETNCIMKHIDNFKPDFVMSIHTPLAVLDFDGPKVKAPNYKYLPWKRLGNFPGSLGRYMWVEQSIPVLTTELRNDLPKDRSVFDQLQDVIGYLVKTQIK